MPPLNEGDIMFMPIADPSISLSQNTEYAKRQDQIMEKFPEVAYVAAKIARAETSTDPAALNMTETIVHLKPRDQWRPGMTFEKLKSEMDRAVCLAWRVRISGPSRSSIASTCSRRVSGRRLASRFSGLI